MELDWDYQFVKHPSALWEYQELIRLGLELEAALEGKNEHE